MTANTTAVLRQALALDERERGALIDALIESLEPERDPGAEVAWDREIRRRMAEIEEGTAEMVPWAEVRKLLSSERALTRLASGGGSGSSTGHRLVSRSEPSSGG